eukprot:Phypoly_transcript_00372.p1 GENE.Phypoly_transcript_00372~~Phypoly_transcript_00372.p1  ORF type:complete len:1575 (+),score=217.10 Phypoly_transcript_00372:123-4847(+)
MANTKGIIREKRPQWSKYLAQAEEMVNKGTGAPLDVEVARKLLEGHVLIDRLPQVKKVVRLFVSSTFTDTEAERNLLMIDVFPYLTTLCQMFGVQFEIVDMRWGVREFTNDDHGTYNLCMTELHKCRAESMGPAFFCLLGDKYGFRPFPNKIARAELDRMWEVIKEEDIKNVEKSLAQESSVKICEAIKSTPLSILWDSLQPEHRAVLAKNDLALIPRWYKLDTNAIPPVYVLQTITTFIPEFRSNDSKERNTAGSRWWKIFEELTRLLRIGAAVLPEVDREKYFMSVTEAEVHNGILNNKDRDYQSFCNRRKITDAINFPVAIPARPKFVDVAPNKSVDSEAHGFLEELKMKKVPKVLPSSNIIDFAVDPALIASEHLSVEQQKARKDYLDQFLDSTCQLITQAICDGYTRTHVSLHPLQSELIQQYNFCLKKRTNISISDALLSPVLSYLNSERESPQVIWGESGSGKTSLMAALIQHFKDHHPAARVIYRFVGISASSSSARQLLHSIYSQIVELVQTSGGDVEEEILQIPSDFKNLSEKFPSLLEQASKNHPLYLFVDSLDQLSSEDDGLSLRWLPWQLPQNVHLVISVLPVLLHAVKALLRGGDECYTAIPRMNPSDGLPMLQNWLKFENRALTAQQQAIAMAAFSHCPLPLYLRVATDIMIKWPSYLPEENATLGNDLPDLISNSILQRLELIHGEKLVSHALGYISAAKEGLSSTELEGVLSCDEEVIKDVYQWWTPPTRILPPMLWKRIRDDLGGYLTEHGSSNALVYKWYHRQFWEAAEKRYLSSEKIEVPSQPIGNGHNSYTQREARHLALAKYFNGDWSSPKMVLYMDNAGIATESDRLIRPQPLQFSGTVYNLRKLVELPYHQTMAFVPGQYVSSLYNFEFISSKFAAKLHNDLIQDYIFAIHHLNAEKYPEDFEKLSNYQRFVQKNMHILVNYPEMALQLAFNGPDSQQVTKDAKIVAQASHKPIFHWINKNQNSDPCLKTIILSDALIHFDISPDNQKVAVVTWGKEIKILSIVTGAQIGALPCGDEETLCMGKFFPDGNRFLTAAFTDGMKIWDIPSGQVTLAFKGHSAMISGCDISPNGKHIISSSSDKTVKVWEAATGNCITTLEEHKTQVGSCMYSPSGEFFASSAEDSVILWRSSDFSVVHRFQTEAGHNPKRIIFSDDGRFLICPAAKKIFTMWDVHTKEQIKPNSPSPPFLYVDALAIAQRGDTVALSFESRIVLFDINTNQYITTLAGHSFIIPCIKFTRDGKYLISGSGDKMKIWDANVKHETQQEERKSLATQFFFSPDGMTAAAISLINGDDFLEVMPATQLDKRTVLDFKPMALMFCPDNNLLVYSRTRICIMDFRGTVVTEFPPPGEGIEVLAAKVSPDGNVLAISFDDRSIVAYNAHTKELIATIESPLPAGSCALSPKGDKIATGSFDGSITLWQTAAPHSQLLQLGGHNDFIAAVAFSLDGQLVASADTQKNLLIWDAVSGELKHSFTERVAVFKFIGRQSFFVIGANDISVYDLTQSPPCVARFKHTAPDELLAGDMYGNRIVAFDGAGRIYELILANWSLTN